MKKVIGIILFSLIMLHSAWAQFGSKPVSPSARPAPVIVVETKDSTKEAPSSVKTTGPTPKDSVDNLKHKAIREHFAIIKLVENHKHTHAMIIQKQIDKHAGKLTQEQKDKLGGALMTIGKIEEVEEIYLPIYDKHFGLEDIVKLNEQFSTPLGQKYITLLPVVNKEAQIGLKEWGDKYEKKIEDFLLGLKQKAQEEMEAKNKLIYNSTNPVVKVEEQKALPVIAPDVQPKLNPVPSPITTPTNVVTEEASRASASLK